MSPEVFVIADLHLGHRSLVEGRLVEGRVELMDRGRQTDFGTLEEMHEALVQNWNSTVALRDKVYVLGDVAIHKKALPILGRMNGRKTLIMGNHDIFNTKEYVKWFENLRAMRVLDKLTLTHVPVHPNQLSESGRFIANVHGHTHRFFVPGRYINVCVENTCYTPVPLNVLIESVKSGAAFSG